jgi:hypothetical protein
VYTQPEGGLLSCLALPRRFTIRHYPSTLPGMPIIGVTDIWKMFEWLHGNEKSNREQDHKRVEGWLDAVYSDINDLSDIWLKISAGRQLSSEEAERGSEILGDIEAMRTPQALVATSLGQFYRSATQVLRPNNPFRDEFLDGLGSLLVKRVEVRDALDRIFLDRIFGLQHVSKEDLEKVKVAAFELQKQAAILKAEITTFKATRW